MDVRFTDEHLQSALDLRSMKLCAFPTSTATQHACFIKLAEKGIESALKENTRVACDS